MRTQRVRNYGTAAGIAALAACVLLAMPGVAAAQPRPPRAFRGLFGTAPPADPDRTTQQLTLTGTVLFGVDDAAGSERTATGTIDTETGYSGVAQVALTYWRGRSSRSISVNAHTGAVAYSTVSDVFVPEVAVNVRAQTDVGRRSSFWAGQNVAYQPYYTLGGFNAISGDLTYAGLPDATSTYGVLDYQSWTYATSVGFDHQWTRAQNSTARYRFSGRHYLDDPETSGRGTGDQQLHAAALQHSVALGRDWSVNGGYTYSHGSYDLTLNDTRRPLDSHGIHGGLTYDRRLSPQRELSLSAGAGATYARTDVQVSGDPDVRVERHYWKPTYFASASIDTWRYWSLWATYRRTFNVLNAVNFETYYGDHFAIGTGGLVSRKVSLSFMGGLSAGESIYGGGDRRDYENYLFSAQAQYALSQNAALTARYYYYFYDVGASALLLPGLPSRLERQGAQIGVTLWWPLLGRRGQPSPSR